MSMFGVLNSFVRVRKFVFGVVNRIMKSRVSCAIFSNQDNTCFLISGMY